jgi:hypothetical protein
MADDEVETRELFRTEAATAYEGTQPKKLEIISTKAA